MLLALAFLAYFGVIVYSDLSRPEDLGVKFEKVGTQVLISQVVPSSPTERAGLKVGDRLTRIESVELGERNESLPTGSTFMVGFNGSYTGANVDPTSFALNGTNGSLE